MGQYEPPKNVQDLAVMAQTLIPVVVEAVQQHLRVLAGDADAESEYTTEKLQEMATEAYRALAKSSTSKLLPLCLVEKEDKGEGGEEERAVHDGEDAGRDWRGGLLQDTARESDTQIEAWAGVVRLYMT